jgi:hypothetical protein
MGFQSSLDLQRRTRMILKNSTKKCIERIGCVHCKHFDLPDSVFPCNVCGGFDMFDMKAKKEL